MVAIEFSVTAYTPRNDAPYVYYVTIICSGIAPADVFIYPDGSRQVCVYQSAYDTSLDAVIRKLADTIGYLAYTYGPTGPVGSPTVSERSIIVALRDLLASLDYECELGPRQTALYIPIHC